MSNSQKISQFNSQTLFNDSDLLTIVRGGQNYNISFADLKASLGVTGTLSQVGDPLGVPILTEPTTADYLIKNIESSKGIIASESAQGGVLLAANYTQGAAGSKVIADLDADQYLYRSLLAGDGINIATTGDAIQITAVDAIVSSKTVIVSVESDFPEAVVGVVTLEADTNYLLVQDISTANRFVLSDTTTISGTGIQNITFTYSGVDDMFTCVGTTNAWQNLRIDAPNGRVFNWTTTVASVIRVSDVVIANCDKIGVFGSTGGLGLARFTNVSPGNVITDGLEFTGDWNGFIFEVSFAAINGGSYFNLGTATFDTLVIDIPITSLAVGTSLISGMVDSGNIVAGGIGVVTRAITSGLGTPLVGVSVDDTRWAFAINNEISDSINDGLMYVEGSTTQTVIASAGVSVKINNVWTSAGESRFDFDSNGRLTYIGERPTKLPIDLTTTLLAAAGGDKQVGLCLAINGSIVTPTCKVSTASSSKAASVTTLWQHEFVNGDYVEGFVSNDTNTENIIVEQAIMRIN